jgi:hypothetical protein
MASSLIINRGRLANGAKFTNCAGFDGIDPEVDKPRKLRHLTALTVSCHVPAGWILPIWRMM